MSPAPGNRPSGIAAFAPIIVAVCAIVIVRELVEAVLPDLSSWFAFIIALVVGWLSYAGVERWYARRHDRSNGPRNQS
jgi:membrane protein implicated in regulation of membrane protease activity